MIPRAPALRQSAGLGDPLPNGFTMNGRSVDHAIVERDHQNRILRRGDQIVMQLAAWEILRQLVNDAAIHSYFNDTTLAIHEDKVAIGTPRSAEREILAAPVPDDLAGCICNRVTLESGGIMQMQQHERHGCSAAGRER